jgi:L-lactate utilization protein LutC
MEGNYSYFARELEHAVRHSLHQSFPETAPDSYEHYENLLDESRQKVLQRFSNQVQQVKYAPITASSETLEQLWNDAKRLIERES